MIEAILPGTVIAVEAREDPVDILLFPAEEASVGQAVEKRRREFTTARACARAALSQLGLPPSAIPSGERGEPHWPSGVVGSITHCDGYRACAIAHSTDILSIGIDAELHAALPEGVLSDIAGIQELSWLSKPRARHAARALGSPAFQREGVHLQGLVSPRQAVARLRGCNRYTRHLRRDLRRAAAGPRAAAGQPAPDGVLGAVAHSRRIGAHVDRAPGSTGDTRVTQSIVSGPSADPLRNWRTNGLSEENIRSASPASTIRPRHSNAMYSPIWRAEAMLWVTTMYVPP